MNMQPGWCQPVRQEFMENECEALPGVAYPGVRDNRRTLNTKTGYDMMMMKIYCNIIHKNILQYLHILKPIQRKSCYSLSLQCLLICRSCEYCHLSVKHSAGLNGTAFLHTRQRNPFDWFLKQTTTLVYNRQIQQQTIREQLKRSREHCL